MILLIQVVKRSQIHRDRKKKGDLLFNGYEVTVCKIKKVLEIGHTMCIYWTLLNCRVRSN